MSSRPQHQQQQTQSVCIRPYQAAVALSNMGVTMIERQAYADAVITIRDALFLIRAFADPERYNDNNNETVLPTDDDVQYMISRATNCLLYLSKSDFNSTNTKHINIKILSDYQSNLLDIFCAVNEADMYLVRIDDTINPSEDYSSAFTMHSKASAVLLNYGTACQCLHAVQRGINHQGGNLEILEEAMMFLKISHRILSRQMEPIERYLQEKNLMVMEIESTRTLHLFTLVLQTLSNVCHKLGQIDEWISFRQEFDCVCTTISKIQVTHYWRYNETAPSA